jgi:hypothetical protein
MTANAEKTKLMEKLPLTQERQDWLKSTIRDINDFPKPGIVFKDLTYSDEGRSCIFLCT